MRKEDVAAAIDPEGSRESRIAKSVEAEPTFKEVSGWASACGGVLLPNNIGTAGHSWWDKVAWRWLRVVERKPLT
jgi:hypothetical protein